MDPRTLIFTKQPVAGRVKTRLVPPFTFEEAAELATAMLDDTVERCIAHGGFVTSLAIHPPQAEAWFRARYPAIREVVPQIGAELGERMANAFARTCAPGRAGRTVVVIGSDCPLLAGDTIAAAHECLAEGTDVVFVPDADGGYVLVGMTRPHPELFTHVSMSMPDMFERTLDVARSARLEVALLPVHADVDRAADVERLALELDPSPVDSDFPKKTFAVLQALLPAS